jgi:hypothetical protein
MIKSIIDKLIHDSKYVQYFDTNKKLSYVMISTGGYKSYEKGRIVFLILQDSVPSLVVKFYKQPNGLIQNEFKKQEIIYEKCNGNGIPKPLGILDLNHLEIMIEEGVKGKSLERHISNNPSKNLVTLTMHKIYSLYNNLNSTLEPSTFKIFNEEINQLLDKFMNLCPLNENELFIVRECVSIFVQHFKNKKIFTRYSNGDFISRNLIVDDEHITLVDFEYTNKTHLYFFDWFRFFKYQYSLSPDYFYSIILNAEINDPFILSSSAEFTKYRSHKQFDIASRMIFEIKEYVLRSDSIPSHSFEDEKKSMNRFISDTSSRLNDKQMTNTQIFSPNDILSSEKEFYQNIHSKIHEYAEFNNKTEIFHKDMVKKENKIKKLVNEKELLQRTNSALSTFINYNKILDTPFKKIVNKLYFEILHRHVDQQGLMHYSLLLETNKITVDDLRKSLLDSNEGKNLGY